MDLEINLKHSKETFVDDPQSLDDVDINELEFDIEHDIKKLDDLHVYHALKIFKHTLDDIMRLQKDPEVFQKFRKEQLSKIFNIDLDHLDASEYVQHNYNNTEPPITPPREESFTNVDSSEFNKVEALADKTEINIDSVKLKRKNDERYNMDNTIINDNKKSKNDNDEYDKEHEGITNGDKCIIEDKQQLGNTNKKYEIETVEGAASGPYVPIEGLIKDFNDKFSTKKSVIQKIRDDIPHDIVYNLQEKVLNQNLYIVRQFNLAQKPDITVDLYLLRFSTYSDSISVSVYIHSAYLIYKLCVVLNIVTLTELNIHRFILASIRCSTKELEDVYQKQKSFSIVGGVSQKDLFRSEVNFLFLCNFKVVATEEIVEKFMKNCFINLRKCARAIGE